MSVLSGDFLFRFRHTHTHIHTHTHTNIYIHRYIHTLRLISDLHVAARDPIQQILLESDAKVGFLDRACLTPRATCRVPGYRVEAFILSVAGAQRQQAREVLLCPQKKKSTELAGWGKADRERNLSEMGVSFLVSVAGAQRQQAPKVYCLWEFLPCC